MANKVERLFPTLVLRGSLSGSASFNAQLLKEIAVISKEDKAGQLWSRENYRGGYTSYASLSDMQFRTPAFAQFADKMQPQALAFAKAQKWLLKGMKLEMNACWVNIMPKHTHHGSHLHPHSAISGTYYVSSPKGSVALKLEDPRMGFYMNAPMGDAKLVYEIAPLPGTFVLFESWLRHEVPPNQSGQPRVSISFNYSMTARD